MSVPDGIKSLEDFWPHYLKAHSHPVNRALHAIGTGLGITILISSVVLKFWQGVILGLVIGYGLAWTGHFVFEKNRPATFKYPLFSLLCDLRLFYRVLKGRVD